MMQPAGPARASGDALPLVSVVIPCRNEVGYIGRCLDSIATNGYPHDRLDVVVADGMSTDGTRELLLDYSRRHPFIRVVDNVARVTPAAFNAGVTNARGDLVMIMSAHATYAPGAIAKCVRYSREYDADNVGGVWRIASRGTSIMDRAVAVALAHPFGVGGATYRTGRAIEPQWVDTAAYGCYRRDVFERVGLFNPKLIRGQDMEFNMRLKRAGGRTLLAPDVEITYYARSRFRDFARHNYRNGAWAVIPFLHSDVVPVSPRHLIPFAFVLSLVVPLLAALAWPAAVWLAVASGLAYASVCILASAHAARRAGNPWLALVLPVVFTTLHVGYGLGSLVAMAYHVPRHYLGRAWSSLMIRPGQVPV